MDEKTEGETFDLSEERRVDTLRRSDMWILGLVVLAAVGIAAWWYFIGKKHNQNIVQNIKDEVKKDAPKG